MKTIRESKPSKISASFFCSVMGVFICTAPAMRAEDGKSNERERMVAGGPAGSAQFAVGKPLLHWPLDEPLGLTAENAGASGVKGVLGEGTRHHAGARFRPGQGWIKGAVDLGSRNGINSEAAIPMPESWTWSFSFNNTQTVGAGFANCGPVKINLGSMDATVEVNGLGTIKIDRQTPNRWEQMSLVVVPGRCTVFVNGYEAGRAEKNGWQGNGEAKLSFQSGMNNGFRGLVDEVRLYDHALQPAEIAELAAGLYHPEAAWKAAYTELQQRLIDAGRLNQPDIDSLIEMGAPDIAKMLTVLDGDNAGQRVQAAFSLGVIHNTKAIAALDAALDQNDTALVRQAVESLGRIRDGNGLPRLIGMLGHADASVREAARVAVGGYGEKAIPLLRASLTAASQAKAAGADAVLTRLQVEPADADEALRRQILQQKWKEIRGLNITSLSPLAEALNRDDGSQAQLAATELTSRGKVAVGLLLDVLQSGSPNGRRLAAGALGNIADPSTAKMLSKYLDSKDYSFQEACARALRSIATKDEVVPLARVLNSGNRKSRDAAAVTLAAVGEPAIPRLAGLLADGSDRERREAVNALTLMRRQTIREALTVALDDRDDMVRAGAVRGLGLIPEPPFGPLNRSLQDPSWLVRREAIVALRRLNTFDARSVIVRMEEDPHALVRLALTQPLQDPPAAN